MEAVIGRAAETRVDTSGGWFKKGDRMLRKEILDREKV
jgi:hypothetical protein